MSPPPPHKMFTCMKVLKSPFQLIKATADIMELPRTQVSFAVESKQCDSIFAVYNIWLQEELKQRNNRAPKTVSSLVIRDHNNTTRLTGGSAEKRRRMNENESKWSGNILQKNRLRNTQAKRHSAVKKRALNSEWWVTVCSCQTLPTNLWHLNKELSWRILSLRWTALAP